MSGQSRTRSAAAPSMPSVMAHRDLVFRRNGLASPSGGSDRIARGYDATAEAYRQQQRDPYADIAAREREMGYRFPDPYAAVAAAARSVGQPNPVQPARARVVLPDLAPEWPIYSPPSVAGAHVSLFGTTGTTQDPYGARIWGAREQAGALSLGGRGPGTDPAWDIQDARGRHVSGRLMAQSAQAQAIQRGRPWLALRSTGTAKSRVTAMMSGGFETFRDFWLGGGQLANFMLGDYESAKVEVFETDDAATEVQFAWVANGMQAGNTNLFYPMVLGAADIGVAHKVPEGAYAVVVNSPDAAWTWTQPGLATYVNSSGVVQVVSGNSALNPVNGAYYTPSIANKICWYVRTI